MADPRFYRARGPLTLDRLVEGLGTKPLEPFMVEESVGSLAPLAASAPGDLSFLESKANLDALGTARATACFTRPEFASAVAERSIIPLVASHPKAAFARSVSRLFEPLADGTPDIHPDAIIHPTAHIGPGVTIGARTRVGAFACIEFADIGEDCMIKPHAVIGGEGLGVTPEEGSLVSLPHMGTVRIGDRVRVGSQTCIDRAMMGETVLEDDVKLDNLVQIAHNCRIGARTILASFCGISGSCNVGRDVRMGGQVGLADHLTIGDGAVLLARSGFMHDVPAGETWMGTPAVPVRQHMREVATLRKLTKPKKKS